MSNQGLRRANGSLHPGAHRGSEPPMGQPKRPQVGGYTMAGVQVAPRDALSPSRTSYVREAFSPTRSMFQDQSPYAADPKGGYRARSYASPPPQRLQQYQKGDPADFGNRITKSKQASIEGTAPTGLTRKIDTFLKKSDHTLDRWQAVLARTGQDTNGDTSQNVPKAAEIAAKAKRHLELLSRVTAAKKAAPTIAEGKEDDSTSSSSLESLDGFDTDDDVGTTHAFDFSDDTSAEISKLSNIEYDKKRRTASPFDVSQLDDLSSDSDDEYFDVLAFNRSNASKVTGTQQPEQQPSRLPPTHSQSLPAVNKVPRSTKMGNLLGNATPAPTESTTATPQIPVTVKEINSTPKQSPYVKRHTAPIPILCKQQIPVTVNEFTEEQQNQHQIQQPTPKSLRKQLLTQPPLAEEVPRTPGSIKKYRAPQPPGSNLSLNSLEGSTQNIAESNKNLADERPSRDRRKAQRIPSFKKGPAPQPPGSNLGSTQSLQSVQNGELSTPAEVQLQQQPTEQGPALQTHNAAPISKTSQSIPNSLPHPQHFNAIDSSQSNLTNGAVDKTDKTTANLCQNGITATDITEPSQNMTVNKENKSKTHEINKPLQATELSLSASWVHLGPQKNEILDTNTAKNNTSMNDAPESLSVGRTKESIQSINSDGLPNGPVPTTLPGQGDVQGTEESVKSKPAHNADQGGVAEKRTDNNIEKTLDDTVNVNKNNKIENSKVIVVDKESVQKNEKNEDKDNVNTEKVVKNVNQSSIEEKDITVVNNNNVDKEDKGKIESNNKTESVDKNIVKDSANTDNELNKSNCVKDVALKKNNEVVSDAKNSCDIKTKPETKKNIVDESKSVSILKGAVDESKKEENKDCKLIANGHIPKQENNGDKDSKPKKEFGRSPTPNKIIINENVSFGESFSKPPSRGSSVGTNRSRTCSPSGPNRGISSKLASICKMLDNDVSERSARCKSTSVSRSSSSGLGAKPGKIDGIASMFERDKMKNKPPPEKDPNSIVGKLLKENPYSPPFNPDPRPPLTKKTKIGGLDISKFGEVTKPTKNMLAAKKAEVLKRTEELKKKTESLKADKAKEIGGKVSDIANKFGKKEESGNNIIGLASKFGKKVEPQTKDKNKVEEKTEVVKKSDESKKDVDKDTKEVEGKKKETEKEIVKDIKGDTCKELDNKKVINEKGILGNNISEGNVDKVEKVEEDKTKGSSIGTNNVDKVEDKTGNKLDSEHSVVKDNDNKKVDNIEVGKESNKVSESMVKLIKGLEEIGNKDENKLDGKNSVVKDNDNKKVDNIEVGKESNKVGENKVKEIKGSEEIGNKDENKVSDVKVEQKDQNSVIKGVDIDKGTGESSKVDVTSPDLDNRAGKKLVNSENEDIATDKSTKTVITVADSVGSKQPVILEESKSLDEGGEVKVKKRRKKKKPEDSTLLSAENLDDGVSSSSESTLKDKVPADENLSPGKKQTPVQDETERSMEEAHKEILTQKSIDNEKKLEEIKDVKGNKEESKDFTVDKNIAGNMEKVHCEGGKDIKGTKVDAVNIEKDKVNDKSGKTSKEESKESDIQQKDDVLNQKIEEKKDEKEKHVQVEIQNEKDDITLALERQIQEANSLIEEANTSLVNKENCEAPSNRRPSLQRSPSTLDPIAEENASSIDIDRAKPENIPSIDHLDKAAVRHLQCLEQKRLTKLSSELTKVRDTLKPVVNRNEIENDVKKDTIVVVDTNTPALEAVSPVAGIVNGKLTARIRPLQELESEVDSLIKDANKLIDPCLMVTPEEIIMRTVTVSPPPATIVKDENGEVEIYHDASDTLKQDAQFDMSKMDTLCELPDCSGIMTPRDRRARSVTSWSKYENGITSPHDRRARSITPWNDNDPNGYMSPRDIRARSIAWGDNENDSSCNIIPRDRRARSMAWGDTNDPTGYVSPRERRARSIALGDNDNINGCTNRLDRRARSVTPWDDDIDNENSRYARGSTPMRIAQTDAILSETDRLLRRSRSKNSLRRSYSRQMATECDLHLSEITADLNEEHSTATLAGERLEAEQAERMKLEKEVSHLHDDVRRIEQERNNIELESLHRRTDMLLNSELNGDIDDEHMDYSLYKRKYEWCLKEIEVLKKQLKTQQEDDLDQLLVLKKQLEKKVSDANEEADEQRQVVAQMKKKSSRLTAEMNDLKILLEEQSSRNNLLEKKQRKFDQDVHLIQEELRHERMNKDKIQREKDSILSEKFSFEHEVSTLKLELELKEEKVSSLNRELDDLNSSGKIEEEVATLKRAKHELELRIKDQEEELDDLAGQVQMLEGAKVRLEMSIEQMRKENRKEIQQREEELDEVRMGAQKKIKALELQIENEHEERTLLVRERHELERRIADLQERTITSIDEDYVHKLKKELKKTKVLLKDTQTMLDKAQSEGSSKLLVRQLKTQLEDAEFAKTAAIKARQSAEADLQELQLGLEEAQRLRKDAEERTARLAKDKTELQTQLDESEEEVAEVMKKYKATVSQLSVDQITLSEQSQLISELEHEKQMMHDRLTEMTSKVEVLEGETANIHTQRRLEMKIKEMESKLELELTTRQRLESQINRLKDQVERLGGECESAKLKESQSNDHSKKLGRQLREAKEDLSTLQQRYTDVANKKQEMEKQMELQDSEILTLKSDLKLAFKRIEEFQQALQGDISDSDSDISDRELDGQANYNQTYYDQAAYDEAGYNQASEGYDQIDYDHVYY